MDYLETKDIKREHIKKYGTYIDCIRREHSLDKSDLRMLVGVSFPTIEKFVKSIEDDTLKAKEKYMLGIEKNGENYCLNSEFSYHVGISVGAAQIKFYICDFNFNPLEKNDYERLGIKDEFEKLLKNSKNEDKIYDYFCYEREQNLEKLIDKINDILDVVIEIDKKEISILTVGLSFPGIINKDTLRIDFSPNIKCLRNLCIKDVIKTDIWEKLQQQKISISVEHDTQAATIYETEFLFKTMGSSSFLNSNIACVYMGAGIGVSMIDNSGKMLRGKTLSFGEFGHIVAPRIYIESLSSDELSDKMPEDKKEYKYKIMDGNNKPKVITESNIDRAKVICECGKSQCLESSFRRDVFNSYTIDDYLLKTDSLNLPSFKSDHPYRYEILKEYIGYIISILINIFNVDFIVFAGRIINRVEYLKNELNTIKAKNALGIPASNCQMLLGSQKFYSAAAGAAISSYRSIYKDDCIYCSFKEN